VAPPYRKGHDDYCWGQAQDSQDRVASHRGQGQYGPCCGNTHLQHSQSPCRPTGPTSAAHHSPGHSSCLWDEGYLRSRSGGAGRSAAAAPHRPMQHLMPQQQQLSPHRTVSGGYGIQDISRYGSSGGAANPVGAARLVQRPSTESPSWQSRGDSWGTRPQSAGHLQSRSTCGSNRDPGVGVDSWGSEGGEIAYDSRARGRGRPQAPGQGL